MQNILIAVFLSSNALLFPSDARALDGTSPSSVGFFVADGQVVIGSAAAPSGATLGNRLIIVSSAATGNAWVRLEAYGAEAFPFYGSRQAGGTMFVPAATASGAVLGGIAAGGHTGTTFTATGNAVILFSAAEAFTPSATGASMFFQTTSTGSTARLTRMTITHNGKVGIGTMVPAALLDVNGSAQFGSGATKSAFTATGFWEPLAKTKAQIDLLVPTKVGQVIDCIDCALPGLCRSTGTLAAQWRKMESATVGCGTNN